MLDRKARLLECVTSEALAATKKVFSQALPRHLSEAQWDELAVICGEALATRLATSDLFEDITHEGDLKLPNGDINLAGVVAAVEELRDRSQGRPTHGVLNHLANHVKHVLTTVKNP